MKKILLTILPVMLAVLMPTKVWAEDSAGDSSINGTESIRLMIGGSGGTGSGFTTWGWDVNWGTSLDIIFQMQWAELTLTERLSDAVAFKLTIAEPNDKVQLVLRDGDDDDYANDKYFALASTTIEGNITSEDKKIILQSTSEENQEVDIKSFVLIDASGNEYQPTYGGGVGYRTLFYSGLFTSTSQWAELYLNGVEGMTNPEITITANEAIPEGLKLKAAIKDREENLLVSIPSGGTTAGVRISGTVNAMTLQADVNGRTIDIKSIVATPGTADPEPYAVLSENNTILTFYYDTKKTERNGMSVGPFTNQQERGWFAERKSITTANFDSSFHEYTGVTSMAYWFSYLTNLTAIQNLGNLNTQNVTDMSCMFLFCGSLTDLDVSTFNTEKVTNMASMFYGCSGLTSLDLANFKTENVTDMSMMFQECSRLSNLNISTFNTSKANMQQMFTACSSLTSIDVRNLDISATSSLSFLFSDCSSLKSIDLSTFNTSHVGFFMGMFQNCTSLTDVNLSNFNTVDAGSMSQMFLGCTSLESLDLSSFNTSNVYSVGMMFYGCNNLKTIYVGDGWTTSKINEDEESRKDVFYGCTNLVGSMGTSYDSTRVDYTYAHIDGGASNPGYFTRSGDEPYTPAEPEPYAVLSENNTVLTFYYDTKKEERNGMSVGPFTYNSSNGVNSEWYSQRESITKTVFDPSFANCSNITSTAYWFDECKNITSISGISNLKTDNVVNMEAMFFGCSSLTSLDLSNFNTANVTDMNSMFSFCSAINWINVSNFNTSKVTDMDLMFNGCSALTSLDLSNFNTTNVTSMHNMFMGCSSLTNLDLSNFNTTNVTGMNAMFFDCSGLTSLDLSNFNTANATEMLSMFMNCSILTTIYAGSGWTTTAETMGKDMFKGCTSLVGGKGTTYDENHVDATYAHIDGGTSNPGYFTDKWGDRKLVQWRQVGGKEYRLYKASNKTDVRTNADGWNMYRTRLTLDIISGTETTTTVVDDGSIYCEQNLFNNAMTQCMMIDVENNKMYVFSNSKTDARDYSMDGYVYISPIEQPSFTKETVFTDANWGWFSYFRGVENGQPLLSHFSYLGYYDELSKRNADGTWSTETEDSPIASASNRESNWLVTRKFTVVGDTSSDEVTLDGVTYTVRNGGNAWVTWLDNGTYVESLTLPETITADGRTLTVSGLAPLSCYTLTRLQSLELPSTMDLLGESVLVRCGNLRSLTVNRNEPPTLVLDNGALLQFTDIDSVNCELRVPYGSKALYESADGWRKFQNIVEMNAPVAEPEPYAVLSDDNTVLTFYYDKKKTERNGMSVGPFDFGSWGWYTQCESITNAIFDPSFAGCTSITSTKHWFYECKNLTSISGIQYLKTDNVTDMSYMFWDCSSLTSLDVSGFKTDNVTDMSDMFYGCSSLTSLDVSGFNTTKVVYISGMFDGCSGLRSLDVSGFNINNGYDMSAMFAGCSGLTSLDLSGFNTKNVVYMNGMFNGCSGLTTIYAGSGWSTASVSEGKNMFTGCTSLVGGKGTKYDASHTDYTYAHIDGGPSNPGYFTDKNAPTIDYTFDYNGVLTVKGETTMADALSAAGGTEEVAKTITAIIWAKATPLTNSDLQGLDNPNMLVYVADASLAPSNRDNVVIGNDSTGYMAKNIMLTDVESGNNNFYCPQEFTAEMISYTRNFQQQTEVGVSRGWETIALPFQVQIIMHEKNGLIAPFGNTSSDKHFWLRTIAADRTDGLSQATQIEANIPYLISMPNSEEYPAEYNQNGRVTFSSQNMKVPVTEPVNAHINIPNVGMVMMIPTFSTQAANAHIYALNVLDQRGEHKEGSIFEANYRAVRPFEAYTFHENGQNPAPRYISISKMNSGTTGIESLTPSLSKGDGAWWTIDGRRLQQKPTQKGVYILNGRKTIIK